MRACGATNQARRGQGEREKKEGTRHTLEACLKSSSPTVCRGNEGRRLGTMSVAVLATKGEGKEEAFVVLAAAVPCALVGGEGRRICRGRDRGQGCAS